jgi:hypothetical protein
MQATGCDHDILTFFFNAFSVSIIGGCFPDSLHDITIVSPGLRDGFPILNLQDLPLRNSIRCRGLASDS